MPLVYFRIASVQSFSDDGLLQVNLERAVSLNLFKQTFQMRTLYNYNKDMYHIADTIFESFTSALIFCYIFIEF